MTSTCLFQKSCVPCQGDVPALNPQDSEKLLKELGYQWLINDSGHLYKHYNFDNFIQAMEFANKITSLAEQEGHHPDLSIAWGKCGVEIWTHKINGLTESDFILAAKIEQLP